MSATHEGELVRWDMAKAAVPVARRLNTLIARRKLADFAITATGQRAESKRGQPYHRPHFTESDMTAELREQAAAALVAAFGKDA